MQSRAISQLIRASPISVIPFRSAVGCGVCPVFQIARSAKCHSSRTQSASKLRQFGTTSIKNYAGSKDSTADKAQNTRLVADITTEKYHKLSNQFMDIIVEKLEDLQEERDDVDVDYISGVLTLVFPPAGTYVINKQPPNKQIWLSSPVSGPKRYDYVVKNNGDTVNGSAGAGEWIYMRDGSLLTNLLEQELGVVIDPPKES